MKKIVLMMLLMLSCVLMTEAQEASYKIIIEKDSTLKYKLNGITLGSREVRYIVYEYQSKDPKGNDATQRAILQLPAVSFLHHWTLSKEQYPPMVYYSITIIPYLRLTRLPLLI